MQGRGRAGGRQSERQKPPADAAKLVLRRGRHILLGIVREEGENQGETALHAPTKRAIQLKSPTRMPPLPPPNVTAREQSTLWTIPMPVDYCVCKLVWEVVR